MRKRSYNVPFKIYRAIKYIEKNYKNPSLSLEEVANSVGMSKKGFSYLWNKTMEMSVPNFINNLRIEEAKKKLLKTPLHIKQISYTIGFSDPGYFGKVFKNKRKFLIHPLLTTISMLLFTLVIFIFTREEVNFIINWTIFIIMIILLPIFHEFGHILGIAYFNGEATEIGINIKYGVPFLYTRYNLSELPLYCQRLALLAGI